MAQNYAFLAYGATNQVSVGPALVTVTLSASTVGIAPSAVRLWNNGTGIAFILFGTTTLTTTGAAANGMPIPQSVAPFVLRTGGNITFQVSAVSSGTVTTTIMATAGEGID
jgi:hypothetical protein